MAAQIAANAQKMGIIPVYFDSESALDQTFLENAGCDLTNLLYVQAISVEGVLKQIEELLKTGSQYLFIWDSLANTPTESDIDDGGFDPNSSIAVKARVLSKGFAKLNIPIYDTQSTLLILNQLKTQIVAPDGAAPDRKYWTLTQKYTTPGGKSTVYNYSLRIWLVKPQTKDQYIFDDKGFKIGSPVKASIIKSRFGSEGRSCEFKILWGDKVGIMDEESLFEAIQRSPFVETGPWNILKYSDGSDTKFRSDDFATHYKENEKFRNRVMEILEEEVILKFNKDEDIENMPSNKRIHNIAKM